MTLRKFQNSTKRAGIFHPALFFIFMFSVTVSGCSLFRDRPIQLMSETAAALKAAREVSADSLSPEKFRLANEAYFRAQNEYRLKNFAIAEDYANRAKRLAEESEFDALRQGSNRSSLLPPEGLPSAPPLPDVSAPAGELATEAMRREEQNRPNGSGASSTSPGTSLPAPKFSP